MLIGFIGDVHGRVFNAIALAAMYQTVTGTRFDLLIQLGDMGAFPNENRMDKSAGTHLTLDPSEGDFRRLLQAGGRRAELLRKMRGEFASSIYFLRGNHEDFDYLNRLPLEGSLRTAPVDPFDLNRFLPDGSVLQFGDAAIAFLGGIETAVPDDRTIDEQAYKSLVDLGVGKIDILATHEPPYGIAVGFRGGIQGSQMITKLLEHTQPDIHVSGHLHHINGPRLSGRTASLSLSGLVASPRWEPHDKMYQPGCIAVLDTETGTLEAVTEEWLTRSNARDFDPDIWFENFTSY